MSVAYCSSPFGTVEVQGSQAGISAVRFIRGNPPDTEVPEELKDCIAQLTEYFEGRRKEFNVKLDLASTPEFYRDVWKMVQAIPYGKTRSYSSIARILGHPDASRAVGQANGRNPVPIIIPCHRVIGKNGDLTGYAYGIRIKESLLSLENPRRYARQQRLFNSV